MRCSRPYIFRLFGSKQELFLAGLERVFDRIASTFLAAAGATDGDVLDAMGHSYATVLVGRDELFLLLQAFSASSDREVRAVAAMSGAGAEGLRRFFAHSRSP